jgi:chorismate mutase
LDSIREALDEYRTQIDYVDEQLLAYLAKRFELSQSIGLIKREANVGIVQSDRAQAVEERYIQLGTRHGLQRHFVTELFSLIHEESCRIQSSGE